MTPTLELDLIAVGAVNGEEKSENRLEKLCNKRSQQKKC